VHDVIVRTYADHWHGTKLRVGDEGRGLNAAIVYD
jgi:hypothetical protein